MSLFQLGRVYILVRMWTQYSKWNKDTSIMIWYDLFKINLITKIYLPKILVIYAIQMEVLDLQ